MDGSVETRRTGPDIAGSLTITAQPPGLAGWVAPAAELGGEPPEIGLDIEGFPTCILTAEAAPGPDGLHPLRWALPQPLRDGVARRARAFHMMSGLELEGSPLILHAPAESSLPEAAMAPGTGPHWPEGLAGIRPAGALTRIADGLLAEAGEPAKTLRFELLAEAVPGSDVPQFGVRLVADALASTVQLHIHLGAAVAMPDFPMAWQVTAWLPEALEPHAKARLDITLERREGAAFVALRRLRRSTLFRQASGHPVEFTLTPEEAESMAAEGVWLGLCAHGAKGLSALLPAPGRPPLPEDVHFEDARLDGSFAHAVEFLRVHGEARAESHPLLPGLWLEPPPAIPARPPGAAHPFIPGAAHPFMPGAAHPFMPGAAHPFTPGAAHPFTPGAAHPFTPLAAHPFTQVILPIHNGHGEVRECLHALRAAATGPMQVVMVDDGSRDFTAAMLRAEAAADPRFILHRRDVNRGYTKSINEGVLLTGADWVVVLNSDTLVAPGWLDRLHEAARARPGTGMVGPLSNAATWQSIPAAKRPDGTWSTNDMIAPHHLERLQALLDEVSERAFPEFPVLNGFCTMIARQVFDTVGLYDEDAFPMGYGEETDLCLRARRAGFRLTLADHCFVYHHKSVSFGAAARARLSRAGGLEMTNKHAGVIVPALELMMQDCAPLGRLRSRLAQLVAELN